MGLLAWFTKNVADTQLPTHADLQPLLIPGTTNDVFEKLLVQAKAISRWTVASSDPIKLTIHLTRRTRVMRFVDDVHLSLSAQGTVVRVDAKSSSRVGVGDLGQNRRNILELFGILRSKLGLS